jgi:hypothetical protein
VVPKVEGAGEVFEGPAGRYQLMHNGVRIAEHCYEGPWATESIRRLRGHHKLNSASRRHIRRALVDAVNRAPPVVSAVHSVVHQWDLLMRKRRERRRL